MRRSGTVGARTGAVAALVTFVATALVTLGGSTPAGAAPTSFVGLVPARLLETRVGDGLTTVDGAHQGVGALGDGATYTLPVLGRGGVPATGVAAVALNVTVTNPTSGSFVTVYPTGQTKPNASNLNMTPGATVSNMVVVSVGAGGAISLFNFDGGTDLIVDVLGWFPTGSGFGGLTPARLLETRNGDGLATSDGLLQGIGPVGPDAVLDVSVLGRGGVPASGVAAVALNVTVTNPTAASFLTVFPSAQARPTASNLNMAPGSTKSNMVIVPIGANGAVSLYNLAGSTDVIVDVLGWFATGPTFGSLAPARLLETRIGDGLVTIDGQAQGVGALGADRWLEVQVLNRGGVPASGVGAVALNVTATGSTAASFLTVYPATQVRPTASNLNTAPGATVSNMVIVPVGSNGRVSIYNLAGQTDLIVDVLGWFPAPDTPGTTTTTTTPITLPETRLVNADRQGPNVGQGTGGATGVAISGNGRYVAFASTSPNLVPSDNNGSSDVFVWDRTSGSVFRVSVRANGGEVSGDSVEPSISNDGSRVAFHTTAALDPLDTNAQTDVYMVDVGQPVTLRRVSAPQEPGGTEGESTWPSISGNGRFVVFNSTSTNLVPSDTNGHIDVFRYDRQTGDVVRASVGPGTQQATGGFGSFDSDISDDGRYVVFSSNETSLGGPDSGVRHIYVRDMSTESTTLLTRRQSDGQPSSVGVPSAIAQDPSISADGAFVMFHSTMSDLVVGDTNGAEDVFRVARDGSGMVRVGLSTAEGMSEGANTMISSTGRYVVFSSDVSGTRQVYRHDADLVNDVLISQSTAGVPADASATDAVISADGKVVAFLSSATNLAGTVTGGGTNVYVRLLP